MSTTTGGSQDRSPLTSEEMAALRAFFPASAGKAAPPYDTVAKLMKRGLVSLANGTVEITAAGIAVLAEARTSGE